MTDDLPAAADAEVGEEQTEGELERSLQAALDREAEEHFTEPTWWTPNLQMRWTCRRSMTSVHPHGKESM